MVSSASNNLAKEEYDVVGIDISPLYLRLAREIGG